MTQAEELPLSINKCLLFLKNKNHHSNIRFNTYFGIIGRNTRREHPHEHKHTKNKGYNTLLFGINKQVPDQRGNRLM